MIIPARSEQERLTLLSYIANKVGTTPGEMVGKMPFELVAAVAADGAIMGAVLYTNYRVNTIEMACAGEPGWMTRAHIRDLFKYPFLQLGCWTVLSMVKRRNDVARDFNERLGFKMLGVIENGLGRTEDSILYTMSRPECRWVPPLPGSRRSNFNSSCESDDHGERCAQGA